MPAAIKSMNKIECILIALCQCAETLFDTYFKLLEIYLVLISTINVMRIIKSFAFFTEHNFFGILACLAGYFGQDCTRKCKSSCKGCNHVTGLCESGCQPGWVGDFCEQGKLSYTKNVTVVV